MSRHQPENGADSPEGRTAYRVTMADRLDPAFRMTVDVPAAYGPRDASHQAEFDHPECIALKAEEA